MTQPAQGEQIVPYSLLKSQILFPGTGFLLGWNSMSSSTVKDVFIFFYLLFLNITKITSSHLHFCALEYMETTTLACMDSKCLDVHMWTNIHRSIHNGLSEWPFHLWPLTLLTYDLFHLSEKKERKESKSREKQINNNEEKTNTEGRVAAKADGE